MSIRLLPLPFALAAAVTGCQQADTSAIDNLKANWRTLEDGSHFASVGNGIDNFDVAERCWPGKEAKFDCILVSSLNSIGNKTIDLRSESELPTILFGTGEINGYGCGTAVGPYEQIKRDDKILVSNQPGYANARWSRSYVQRFMSKNGVKGQGYFPCLEILNAMAGGSLETLSTTEVDKSMMGA